jgi:DNA (cytosine-5)-methyltransferase 1
MTKSRTHVLPFLFPEMSLNPWHTPRKKYSERGDTPASLTTLELCAGAGGQALGFEQAGIGHAALVEIDGHACSTLRPNRPEWNVIQQDLNTFSATSFRGVDIISGGLPCPPFSVAGKQLGTKDERNLFPVMTRLVDEIRPRAVLIENVRGTLDATGMPKVTARMLARSQSSPDGWQSRGAKTAKYRLAGRALAAATVKSFAETIACASASAPTRIAG